MQPDRPNVVLVTVDSLRADHCGYVNPGKEGLTPAIDRLAEEGVGFTNAISPGIATPESMPAIFTGRHLSGVSDDFAEDLPTRKQEVDAHLEKYTAVPELLSERGYRTAGFTPNPYASRGFGFDRGFDHFEDFLDDYRGGFYERLFEGFLADASWTFPLRTAMDWIAAEGAFKPWGSYLGEIVDWIDGADRPYFLWVLILDAHDPYIPPSVYRSQSTLETYLANWRLYSGDKTSRLPDRTHNRVRTAYEDAVRYSDRFVEQLLDHLDQGETFTIVHADHGESLGERGTYGHRHEIREENVHVPFVVHGPCVEAGDRSHCTRPTSLRRLPELLDAISRDEVDAATFRDLSADYVTVKSVLADKRAIRGEESKAILDESADEYRTYRLDDGEEDGTPPDAETLATELLRWLRTERELEAARAVGNRTDR